MDSAEQSYRRARKKFTWDGKRIEAPGPLTSRMCYAGLLNKRSAATAVL